MAVMLSSLRLARNRCPRQTCHRLVSAKDLQKNRLRWNVSILVYKSCSTMLTSCSDHCQLVYYPYNPQRMYGPRSELRIVTEMQSRHDHNEHGLRYHPADQSMIASVSAPTITVLSDSLEEFWSAKSNLSAEVNDKRTIPPPKFDMPIAGNAAEDDEGLQLSTSNLLLWQDQCVQDGRQELSSSLTTPPTNRITQLGIDQDDCPSAMMIWLYSSAIPTQADHPPPIEDILMKDSEPTGGEVDDLETLRRVCIARSMPAARHYLDAPEYTGMDGQAVLYLRKILDSFPKTPPAIARRLAQRNLAWAQKTSQRKTAVSLIETSQTSKSGQRPVGGPHNQIVKDLGRGRGTTEMSFEEATRMRKEGKRQWREEAMERAEKGVGYHLWRLREWGESNS